ncbi:hypothetical protein ABMA28_008309 [Loxostege sticticalis]|uniref:THAP-type domain-containing protein n=1 Tax=Loxostege sticticalis TaxID=481309 RepID=A0ABD0SIZ7_LOXSC
MVSCSVMDCFTTKRHNSRNFSFHRFPTNLDIRKTCLKLINRPNWISKKYSCICSKLEDKFLQARGLKQILMKSGIPTNIVPVSLNNIVLLLMSRCHVYRDIVPEASTCESS